MESRRNTQEIHEESLLTSTVPRSAGFGCMPNGCVITRYAELSAFLYNGFAIRLRIFSCRLARSYFLFLFLPIMRQGAVRSNVTAENLGALRQRAQLNARLQGIKGKTASDGRFSIAALKVHAFGSRESYWSSQHLIVQMNTASRGSLNATNTMDAGYLRDASPEQKIVISK
jgi:hypothetical protein